MSERPIHSSWQIQAVALEAENTSYNVPRSGVIPGSSQIPSRAAIEMRGACLVPSCQPSHPALGILSPTPVATPEARRLLSLIFRETMSHRYMIILEFDRCYLHNQRALSRRGRPKMYGKPRSGAQLAVFASDERRGSRSGTVSVVVAVIAAVDSTLTASALVPALRLARRERTER